MIKNRAAAVHALGVALLAAVVTMAGCDRHATPPGYQGIVEFEERRLAFEIGGRIVRLDIDEGDEVKAGEVVAALDDTLERTATGGRAQEVAAARASTELVRAGARAEDVRAMAAQVEAARANEQLLLTNLEREQRLLAREVGTQAAVEELQSRHRGAVAERRSLEQKLRALREGSRSEEVAGAEARENVALAAAELATERLALYQLRALEAGTVLDVTVERGEVVAAGRAIATVADVTHPYADVFVPQAELAAIRLGASATVKVDAQPQPLAGKVEHIAREAEFTPRFLFSEGERPNLVVRVRVRIDDPQRRLHAGVPAFVAIAAGPR